jgi:biopolymer transport protein ExbB
MKTKIFAFVFAATTAFSAFAQDTASATANNTTEVDTAAAVTEAAPAEEPAVKAPVEQAVVAEKSFHEVLKEKFIEGGAEFMTPVLLCLILGLGVSIERIISLNLASTNTKKLLDDLDKALTTGGVPAALDITRKTAGPIASIFTQGLLRHSEGIDMVEKSIVSYGSVEMSKLEKGLTWISLFIALAPMLGFLGTVVGMIGAFDAIAIAGDVSPSLVAGGIKVALITTVGGLIVAIILQVFYNYITSKVETIVGQMEDASINFVDLLIQHSLKK